MTQNIDPNTKLFDVGTIEGLGPSKFDPIVKEGNSSTYHTVTKLSGVGLRLNGDRFVFVSATGDRPAHMLWDVHGIVKVFLRHENVSTNHARLGEVPLDIEVCALIVRDAETGQIKDRHVYLNVWPAEDADIFPTEVMTVHPIGALPKSATVAYHGRKGAVAICPVPADAVETSEVAVAVTE